ncbi:class IV adenylate cyclase [Desulfovibrio inopinatus]|uniref:class IV adenylate cyclase n=1 Tax=Desulfovibrio inopinatus TaxID=102109 RepID=UPI00041B6595|nr:class IV adenylate cyclase [Desulfovibrio inopinatus]
MHLEIERKYCIPGFSTIRKGLRALGAVMHSRMFEENIVYDTPDRRLCTSNMLLRVRQDDQARITLKLPSSMSSDHFKVMEELETVVEDYEIIKMIFHHLGFIESLRYEKIRETWLIAEGTVACLDHLVFGNYIEFEGDADTIEKTATALGLADSDILTENYHQLNCAFRQAQGLPPDDNFVFSEPERSRLIASLSDNNKDVGRKI